MIFQDLVLTKKISDDDGTVSQYIISNPNTGEAIGEIFSEDELSVLRVSFDDNHAEEKGITIAYF